MLTSITSYLWGSAGQTESDNNMDIPTDEQCCAEVPCSGPQDVLRFKTRDTEDEWVLVDPSRGHSPDKLQTGPLENLLIEHPSMSVYALRRPNSRGPGDSDQSSEDGVDSLQPRRSPRLTTAGRLALVSTEAQAQSGRLAQRAARRVARRQMAPAAQQRSNRAREAQRAAKPARRKDFLRRPSGRISQRC